MIHTCNPNLIYVVNTKLKFEATKKLNEGVLLKQAKKLNQGVIYFLDCHEGVLLKQAKKLKFVSVFLLEEKKIYTYRVYVIGCHP
ncbi:hypothetical protein P8452_60753 [Trifolium repens]|nr:hypothetical protein P8452_60753 [Trifolium repens]